MVSTTHAEVSINIGMASSSSSSVIQRLSPFMQYLKNQGVNTGKIINSKNLEKLIKKIKKNRVQMTFESAYSGIKIMDKTGAIPVLIREKSGKKQYNSVIFARASSQINTFDNLKNKVIAFEDKASTSSFLLPAALLKRNKLELEFSKEKKSIAGKVAYYFSKDDTNTIAQVLAGKADAGGIKKSAIASNKDFKIIGKESEYIPRHIVLISSEVSKSQREKIVSILLKMKEDPKALEVLKKMRTPTGFSKFDKDPIESMNAIRNILDLP